MSEKQSNMPPEHDRRAYFRVDDSVRLSLRPVPEEEVGEIERRLRQGPEDGFTVMSSLAAVSAEMMVNLRRIENSDPDVAAYLKALDRKIEILGRAFIACDSSDLVEAPAHPVNLSAGGMAALVDEAHPPGQVLEVRLLLFPSFTGVRLYGTVVDCEPAPESAPGGFSHRLRIAFTHVRETDRDLIIRHVLRAQSQALRRGGGEDPGAA